MKSGNKENWVCGLIAEVPHDTDFVAEVLHGSVWAGVPMRIREERAEVFEKQKALQFVDAKLDEKVSQGVSIDVSQIVGYDPFAEDRGEAQGLECGGVLGVDACCGPHGTAEDIPFGAECPGGEMFRQSKDVLVAAHGLYAGA